jgi:hypothetical protein
LCTNAAYRPFVRLTRFPCVSNDNLLGKQALEQRGYRIMASLYDGDPRVVFDIMLDAGSDPSVRFRLIALEGNLIESLSRSSSVNPINVRNCVCDLEFRRATRRRQAATDDISSGCWPGRL